MPTAVTMTATRKKEVAAVLGGEDGGISGSTSGRGEGATDMVGIRMMDSGSLALSGDCMQIVRHGVTMARRMPDDGGDSWLAEGWPVRAVGDDAITSCS